MMDIISLIDNKIRNACMNDRNKFGPDFYHQHIKVVERYANTLADLLKADKTIVTIASLIHDIAAVSDFSTLPQHPIAGAEITADILREQGFPAADADLVCRCVRLHSAPVQTGQEPPEIVCVSNADAISQIVNPMYWLFYAFNVRGFDYAEGKKWYHDRIISNRQQLIEPARALCEKEYAFSLALCRDR